MSTEEKKLRAELRQIDALSETLNERRSELRRKLEGVSTLSNARKGLSDKEAGRLVHERRKTMYS